MGQMTKSGASRIFMIKDGPTVVEWAMNAKHTGEMMGVKATEKDVGFQGADVIWFTPEGQIKEEHVYHDIGTRFAVGPVFSRGDVE